MHLARHDNRQKALVHFYMRPFLLRHHFYKYPLVLFLPLRSRTTATIDQIINLQ